VESAPRRRLWGPPPVTGLSPGRRSQHHPESRCSQGITKKKKMMMMMREKKKKKKRERRKKRQQAKASSPWLRSYNAPIIDSSPIP